MISMLLFIHNLLGHLLNSHQVSINTPAQPNLPKSPSPNNLNRSVIKYRLFDPLLSQLLGLQLVYLSLYQLFLSVRQSQTLDDTSDLFLLLPLILLTLHMLYIFSLNKLFGHWNFIFYLLAQFFEFLFLLFLSCPLHYYYNERWTKRSAWEN